MFFKLCTRSRLGVRSFSSCCASAKTGNSPGSHTKKNEGFNLENYLRSTPSELKKSQASKATNRFANLYNPSSENRQTPPRRGKPKERGDRNHHSQKKKRAMKFQFETGSDQAQAALKEVITKVHSYGTTYWVQFLDQDTKKIKKVHLVDVVNHTDFGVHGLLLVPPKEEGDLPLIRLNKVQDMIKDYANKLAAQKERELLEKGSYIAKKAVSHRAQAEKKKSATKVSTLSWNINVGDLLNQKKNEIVKRVNKDEKFVIFVGEKNSLMNVRRLAEKSDGILKQMDTETAPEEVESHELGEEEFSIESRRREMIFEKIKELLEECECKYEVSGNVQTRIALNCSPKPSVTTKKAEAKTEEVSPREAKRLRKLAKQKEQKKSLQDEDLDSLYLLKIDE